jgi:hypothetical protein
MLRTVKLLGVVQCLCFVHEAVGQSEKKDDDVEHRVRGTYMAVSTNLKTRERTNCVCELTANHDVVVDGKPWGKWDTKKTSVVLLPDDKDQAEFELRFKTKTLLIGMGESKKGQKISWEMDRVYLVAVWEHQAGNGKPGEIRLWSNGRVGRPDGRATWKMNPKDASLVLKWPEGWIDTCKISSDGKRYEGRNQNGTLISGKLISKGELEESTKDSL